jgi:hypothetical protein
MRLAETIAGLTKFEERRAGTDAERRAANWLVSELTASGRGAQLEPFWFRANWALGHVWHVALGLAGSLVAVSEPRVGGAIVLVALLSLMADAVIGFSAGRRLTPERASQNVVAASDEPDDRVRLIVTANYDAGRTGLMYRDGPRSWAARLRIGARGRALGWLAWTALALVWVLAVAIIRSTESHPGAAIGLAQLIPTVGLVLALALLLDQAGAATGPAAGDNASGVAVALALVRALDAAPPSRLAVEVVLEGAGEGGGMGLRRHLRARRRVLRPENTIVLGIAACGAGQPRWWTSDGAFLPLRFHPRLRALCQQVASEESHLGAAPHRGRGATPALPARAAGIPAISIGCLDERGLAARSHQATDTAELIDDAALEAMLAMALALVDAIDVDLARTRPQPAAAAA